METLNEVIYREIPSELSFDNENLNYEKIKFEKNQDIFKENVFPVGLFYVKTGKVKIFKISPDGKEKILRIMKTGDFVGYKDLILRDRYTYYASAFENTTLYFIPKDSFYNLLNHNTVNLFFMNLLSEELSDTENELLNLSYKPVKGRLVDALLTLDDNSHSITISREELAGFVGSATETVIRLLSELRKQNLISIKGRMIQVVNTPGLNRISSIYN
ncbi:MAG TPA: Crp/Fnr family transcriptional regulator [Ignavibacteria bacterium]|nr:Crp/Fnr family transcriptional regulator [Ignavibacteria bacterium]